jgi:excisionase family DNA binding protein
MVKVESGLSTSSGRYRAMSKNESIHDRLLSAREVSTILGLSEASVRRLAAEGRLPSVRPFGLRVRRFWASEIHRIARGEPASGESDKA